MAKMKRGVNVYTRSSVLGPREISSHLTKDKTIRCKAILGEQYAIRSANSMLTAVNQFLNF